MNYGTLPSRFLNVVDNLRTPARKMVRGRSLGGHSRLRNFSGHVAGLSTAFVELGVKPGDRVWPFSATAPSGIPRLRHQRRWRRHCSRSTSRIADRMTYILKHCGAKVVFVVGAAQLRSSSTCARTSPRWNRSSSQDVEPDVQRPPLRNPDRRRERSGHCVVPLRASQVLPTQAARLAHLHSGTTGEPRA